MRRPLIAGNWKMFKTVQEAADYVNRLKSQPLDENIEVAILAPFTCLPLLNQLDLDPINYGAQNLFWEDEGAYTGEISPAMLSEFNCKYVIVGHSERRKIMQETDQQLNRKLKAAWKHKLIPILCVGETLEERERGEAEEVVGIQLQIDLDDIPFNPELVIAYEPVWAIGTGVNATAVDAEKMSRFIRDWLADRYGIAEAQQIRILYGGSVKPQNIAEFMKEDDIDGALVGGASLDPESFAGIINYK